MLNLQAFHGIHIRKWNPTVVGDFTVRSSAMQACEQIEGQLTSRVTVCIWLRICRCWPSSLDFAVPVLLLTACCTLPLFHSSICCPKPCALVCVHVTCIALGQQMAGKEYSSPMSLYNSQEKLAGCGVHKTIL